MGERRTLLLLVLLVFMSTVGLYVGNAHPKATGWQGICKDRSHGNGWSTVCESVNEAQKETDAHNKFLGHNAIIYRCEMAPPLVQR
jgi:hypothetical protein